MDKRLTIHDAVAEAISATGERWRLMPDKLAASLDTVLSGSGFRVKADAVPESAYPAVLLRFMPCSNGPVFTTLAVTIADPRGGSDDGIEVTLAGRELPASMPIWDMVQPAYDNLVQMVRMAAYARYTGQWIRKAALRLDPYAEYEAYLTSTCMSPDRNADMPDFSQWAEHTGWGTWEDMPDINAFVKGPYLERPSEWTDFREPWMRSVYERDADENAKPDDSEYL